MFSCLHVKYGLVWFKGQNIIAWMCTRVMKEMYTAIACVTLCRTHVKPQSKALHLSSMRVHQPRDVLALKSSKSKCVTHPLHTARAHQPCYDWALKSHKFKCVTHPLHIPFILRVHTNPVMNRPLNHTNSNVIHIHYTSPSYCAHHPSFDLALKSNKFRCYTFSLDTTFGYTFLLQKSPIKETIF